MSTAAALWVVMVLGQVDAGVAGSSDEVREPVVESAPAAASQSPFEVLAAEVRRLKEDLALPAATYQSFAGMGPAASKVYFAPKGLSLGGYGEAYYSYRPAPGVSQADLLRFVLYVGYRFSDRIIFNSEVEFEHGSTERGGAVSVEFAYLDFKLFDALTLRAGNVLVPMGFINDIHEPPFFFGVQRPTVERSLIPATWNENGLGLYGELKGLRYRAYLINGMRAIGGGGFNDSSWVRGGRQGGAEAIAKDLAVVAAVDYSLDVARFGVSAYYGRSGQGAVVNDAPVRGDLFLGEAHAALQYKGFWLRGLIAYGHLWDAGAISTANGVTVGQETLGGYGEVAYDVLRLVESDTEASLSPFVRVESLDTNRSVAAGFDRNPSVSRQIVTAGVQYKPLVNVVIKADYQHVFSGAGQSNSVNAGVGFAF